MATVVEPAPTIDARTINATGERVAVLETRVGALKEDTSSIRAGMHDIRGEMQRFVAAEMRCVEHLAKILDATKDLPVLVSSVAAFNEMRPELRAVFEERSQRAGLSAFGKRFSMVVVAAAACIAALGGIAGGLVWLSQHLKPL